MAILFAIPLSAAPKVRLKIAATPPERSIWGKVLEEISDQVKRETDGQVEIKVYAGGVQGDERTVVRKMRIGQLQGAALVGQGVQIVCPDTVALSLPFIFRTEAEVLHVLKNVIPNMEAQARERGYEILAWSEVGFSHLYSRDEVRTIEMLRKAKPWQIESDPLTRYLMEELKVTAVPTDVGNVLTSLQTGLLRTVFSPPSPLIALQWHSRVEYRLDVNLMYSLAIVVVSSKAWNRVPKETRQTVRDVFKKRNAELNEKARKQNLEALRVIEKQGVKTVSIEPKSLVEFREAARKVGERMAGKDFSREMLDRVRRLLKEYRDKNPESDGDG
jgi:TRAP-type C4-dicarboxylate transport system substrate-binding protein